MAEDEAWIEADDVFESRPQKAGWAKAKTKLVATQALAAKQAFGEEEKPLARETREQRAERHISAKRRNYLLVVAFVLLLADMCIAMAFALMSPTDERTSGDYVSRKLLRTAYLQGFVALIDGIISVGVIVHVVAGVMAASLDCFLEAAAVKTSQATFFTLMQFGYPTVLRLLIVTVLLLLRIASTTLIVRVAWLAGILTSKPSKELPKVVQSLLEAGTIETGHTQHMDRPLTIGLVERLLGWLLPTKERTAAVGLGRRQLMVIAAFLLLMSSYMAFSDYWSVLGEQDEFFEEEQKAKIIRQGFHYLRTEGSPVPTVTEAKKLLESELVGHTHRVVVIVLSGLRYDALGLSGGGGSDTLREFREEIDPDSFICKIKAEVPSLSLPNWVAIMSGVTPEVHGLLGNRAPPEALFSSLTGVARELGIENVLIGTSWFVDLFRSQVTPLSGDGSCSASWEEFEALGPDAANNDLKREQALMMAINGTARLVVAQLSAINSAGHLHGVSYSESAPYGRAVVNKVGVLREVMALIDRQDANITTVILSDHGHLGRGGTGGASGEERDVPLLVHRRGSGLGSAGSCADGNTYTMVDVAPTLAAILRAPAPRHSSGKYIAPIFTAEDAVGQDMGLRTWQWRDLYYQRRAFAEGFLEHPEVRYEVRLSNFDERQTTQENIALDTTVGWEAALVGLENMFRTARSDASNAHSARNQGLAFCVLLTMILVCIAIMQLQTYCDPLALLPRKQNKGAADGPAFKFAFGLTFAYFGFCLIVFAGWLLAFGYHWNSSIVSRPENVRNFMLVSLLPGFGAAFLARRAIAVRFARKPEKFDGVQGMLNFALIESVEAFERMDSYYLTLFYWNLCAILAVCLFGLLSSQFSFILPLIFYSKYIDASTWEYRFQIMTLQIMATPLQLWTIGALAAWGGTRIDKPSMMQLHELKVRKADRRELPEEDEDEAGGTDGDDAQKTGGGRKDSAKKDFQSGLAVGKFSSTVNRMDPIAKREALAERMEKRRAELKDLQETKEELLEMKADLTKQSDELQTEIDVVEADAKHNQALISSGIKGLEEMILERFRKMQEKEEAEARGEEVDSPARKLLTDKSGGDDFGRGGGGDEDDLPLDPLARRRERQRRLVEEQRKRIAEEEREKSDAEQKIRQLQSELTRLLEANANLQRKVEACEHNVLETREAIEDMEFQTLAVKTQKENALAVLSGEVTYLNEHQVTVQRKSSELSGKMVDLETSLHAAEHRLQRVKHAQELATAEQRRENELLVDELVGLEGAFEAVRRDVQQLYEDKVGLRQQLVTAKAETEAVEASVASYRRGMADLLDV